ncbi:phosphatase PAP2 family protein [Bacillus sp. 179-C3.3 HS]|uniref:phosphatase PAP2 family protein n=1 Tax=Bacillus sp. 179-C3.3 HS TaxID=3232162 RepID=UPI0039A3BC8B
MFLFIMFGAMAVLMTSGIFQEVDNHIILWFETMRLPILNDVMFIVTDFGMSLLLVPIMLIVGVVLFTYKRYHSMVLLFLLYLIEITVNHQLKEWFARERPSFQHLVDETFYSFPSGHAMNAATLYPFMAYLFVELVPTFKKRQKTVYFITALLVILIGMSRMYLGVHYLTDVVGGFVIGLGLFLLFKKIDERICIIRQK